MSLNKIIEAFTLLFVSFQGVLLLIDPQHRNRIYSTLSAINVIEAEQFESFAEHGRLIIALLLIPTCLYPRFWIKAKFVSLVAYVIQLCVIYNFYLFHTLQDIAHFIFHFLILFQVLLFLVDDLLILDMEERKNLIKISQKSSENIVERVVQTETIKNEKMVAEEKPAGKPKSKK